MLVIICGLPGVGKTTLAKSLAPLIYGIILSSDKIRKELFPSPTYSQSEQKTVFDTMLIAAKNLSDAGTNCILDATFNKEQSRTEVKNRLGLTDDQFHVIECSCPEDIIMSRLESRKNDYSDATVQVYQKMKSIREPVKSEHITLDTVLSPEENARKAIEYISKRLSQYQSG
ncbi:MAG: AAA family ATPase [Thaumarchaeota archaeon]|nr:AAA family ATPase [Nitrososphaerota archaeon]MDE1841816.1 AAA family ATPase [Nitrososphaerota archaeon]MDE1878084.1 AAA family ATPase [Nitrososphaerota archaeon]